MSRTPLVLASKSPRRAELLQQIGVVFEPVSVQVEEYRAAGEKPEDYVARLAREKSAEGAKVFPGRVSLGADTIVLCDDLVLEKPADREDCLRMLSLLSGKTHRVMTAVALTRGREQGQRISISEVSFRHISASEAGDYWASGEPVDKAGAYGIQGLGAVFVESIQGSYSGIVGLPLFETQTLLQEFAIPYWQKGKDYP